MKRIEELSREELKEQLRQIMAEERRRQKSDPLFDLFLQRLNAYRALNPEGVLRVESSLLKVGAIVLSGESIWTGIARPIVLEIAEKRKITPEAVIDQLFTPNEKGEAPILNWAHM